MSANEGLTIWMRLQGARQVAADATVAADGIAEVGVASEETAARVKLSNAEMRLMQQGMYSLRRYAFYATTAVLTFAAGALKLGLSFDEAKAQGTNAFTALLGSQTRANREMTTLLGITHTTGLQLTTLAQTGEQMQGFGFTIKQINVDMAALANFAERAHIGASGFASLVNVFDRIRSSGKLTSLDIRTLTLQGVPALQILQKQLGLTAAQLVGLRTGKLIIPSTLALPALAAGIGGRANQLGTNIGQQVGIAHSYLSQLLGGGESGVFSFATGALEQVNAALKARTNGGSFLQTLDPSGTLILGWNLLTAAVKGLIAPFVFVYKVGKDLAGLFPFLGSGLKAVAKQTWLVQGAMFALATWYTITRTGMLAMAAAQLAWNVVMYGGLIAIRLFTLATTIASAGVWDLNFAMDANPIGLVILAVAGLGAGIYLLVKHFKELVHWAKEAWHWVSHFVGWLFDSGGTPGITTGAATAGRGSQRPTQVGVRAPARAVPTTTRLQISPGVIHVNLDGKKIAENTFEWQAKVGALQ